MTWSEYTFCASKGFGLGFGIGFLMWAVRKVKVAFGKLASPPGNV